MDTHILAALENAVEPYLQAGYMVTAQSDRAITLVSRPKQFSYLGFIIALLLFWPAAIVYLIAHNNRRNRIVCVRIDSDGRLEESGYTFEVAALERQHEKRVKLIAALLCALAAVGLLVFLTQRI